MKIIHRKEYPMFFKIIGGILVALALIVIGGEPSLEMVEAGKGWDMFYIGVILAVLGGGCLWLGHRLTPEEDSFFS